MKIKIICPECYNIESVDYTPGVLDTIFYDEPRFPGSTVFNCPVCSKVVSLGGEGIVVKVNDGGKEAPIKIKTDDYEMSFRIRPLVGETKEYNIKRLEEVMGRFFTDGSIPD